jgi:hypothetical protein
MYIEFDRPRIYKVESVIEEDGKRFAQVITETGERSCGYIGPTIKEGDTVCFKNKNQDRTIVRFDNR